MKDNTKKTLKIYWCHALNHKVSGLLVFFGTIGASAVNVIIPLYYRDFFNYLVSGQPQEVIVKSLISTIVIIAIWNAVQWAFWRVATFSSSYFQTRIMADLSDQSFAYLHQHSFSFFNNSFVGSLVKKVRYFTNSFEDITDKIAWNFLPLVVNITIILGVLWQRNTYLALGIFVWTAMFLAINWFFTKYKLKYDIKRSEAETKTTAILADTITNSSNVKLFNGYDREVKGFDKAVRELTRLRKLTWDLGNLFEAVQGVFSVALEIGIMYMAIKLWQQGVLTVGDFVLLQAYLLNIFMRVWDFGRIIRGVYERLADAEEMTIILNRPHEIKDIPGARDLVVEAGQIEFKQVDFCYHETRKVLNNFSLVIKPRERLALIGPSGAGKSTVIKLLLRMHDLSGGKILIDGQDIARVKLESLWSGISLVPQEPMLFHRTLKENIRYGKPDATNEEIIAAAKAANCDEFISSFPEGYDTYVGERGVKLSGGERQRVAIARAILRNAPILVLDEATSSLDSGSEKLIQEALGRLMKEKTVIVIAHRLSTIRQMDRIVVIDTGGIIEEGTHETLTKKSGGMYQKLWQLQAGGFIQ